MMTNVNVLKTFVAVIDSGSVAAAAHGRGYSPAAVSRQIGWLQRRLGVRLFVPDGRSIRPTQEALEFADRARALVVQVSGFERYSEAFASAAEDRLHRACLEVVET